MNDSKTLEDLLADLELSYPVESIIENPFDYIRSICRLYDDNEESDEGRKKMKVTDEKLQKTKQLLKLLPSICRPKELLLALLEEANSFNKCEKFQALMEPINDCLLLIANKRHQSVVLAFETLCAHIQCQCLPDSSTDCIESLDAIQFQSAFEDNIYLFLSYFKNFIQDIHLRMENAIKNNEDFFSLKSDSLSLSLILLKLFAMPFAYKKWSFVADTTEMISLELFSQLQRDGIKFISETLLWKSKNDEECEKMMEGKVNEKIEIVKSIDSDDSSEKPEKITWDVKTGLGTLAYSMFNEQYCGNLIPQHYTPTYLFLTHLQLITHLLAIRKPNSHPADKGCHLVMYFLKRIGTGGMNEFSLDQAGMKSFVEKLIEVSTSSNVKEISQKCLACLNALIWCIQPAGRVELLNFILHNTEHAGLLGFIITAVKNQVDESLKNENNVFTGSVLDRFAKVIFVVYPSQLHQGNKNEKVSDEDDKKVKQNKINILDETDRIMSCLNFLRFLLLKQHQMTERGNSLNLKNILPSIETNFINPLKTELARSRVDSLAELSKLHNGRSEAPPITSVTVGSEVIDGVSVEDRLKMINIVLTNIDLVESVLTRTETLISNPSDGTNAPHKLICPLLAHDASQCSNAKCPHKITDSTNPNEISHLTMKLNSRISPL
ncbi:hypothetical protein HELRODRAFT_185544 [Helobdella robusta]|uniref:Uncharacterized protein n=1 Tax=Helobdella robusta TaxID=6412 RepID=T1FMY7_HELRO|nr:hypothetical protein HELRODRAFT_185544 [Helobdella robusta]ESO05024.1 hypothetical protein HELRODRAFT_185544 [Helobdella robusta]